MASNVEQHTLSAKETRAALGDWVSTDQQARYSIFRPSASADILLIQTVKDVEQSKSWADGAEMQVWQQYGSQYDAALAASDVALRLDELVEEGAKSASSPKEVAESSDVIITMLTDSPDVEDVILQPTGILEGLKENAILIDMSTISPKVTQKIACLLERKGAHMLDAPVSGGLWGAVSGTLAIMVGGDSGR